MSRTEQGGGLDYVVTGGKVFKKEQKKSRPPKGTGIETLSFLGGAENYVSFLEHFLKLSGFGVNRQNISSGRTGEIHIQSQTSLGRKSEI